MSLNIEIIEEKKNPLVERTEIKFKIDHFGKGTPNRLEVKKKIAAMQGANEKLAIVKKIKTHFGSAQVLGTLYIYDNADDLQFYEPLHIQIRNLPAEKRTEIINLRKKKQPFKHLFEYK